MRALLLVLGAVVISATSLASAAQPEPPEPNLTTLNFAVIRNGAQIGTSMVRLRHQGRETTAEIATRIQVKIAYVTVYRFDHDQTEHWADGNLMASTSVTNDNGTVHKVTARRVGNTLSVEANGKTSAVDPNLIPFSLWNPALLQQTMALDLQDGSVTPVSVVNHGEKQLVLEGRPTKVRHYSIKTSFPQEVWFDANDRLVKVELRGSDGSRIHYQRG